MRVGGKAADMGAPASSSRSFIAAVPSISTQTKPPLFDHTPVINPTPVAFPSLNSRFISSIEYGCVVHPATYALLPCNGVRAQSVGIKSKLISPAFKCLFGYGVSVGII